MVAVVGAKEVPQAADQHAQVRPHGHNEPQPRQQQPGQCESLLPQRRIDQLLRHVDQDHANKKHHGAQFELGKRLTQGGLIVAFE